MDITTALNDDDTTAAIEAYQGIRRALVLCDDMSEEALIALKRRVVKAAGKYRGGPGRANAAMTTVLEAYATYVNECLWEKDLEAQDYA
jgi:hypothetical protein